MQLSETINTEKMTSNFTMLLMRFARYLNDRHKFNVSVDSTVIAINTLSDSDVFDKDAAKEILKTILCKNAAEFCCFDEIFDEYFADTALNKYNNIVECVKTEEIKKVTKSFPTALEVAKELDNEKKEDSEFLKYESDIRKTVKRLELDEWQETDLINVCKQDQAFLREMMCRFFMEGDSRYTTAKENLESLMKQCIVDSLPPEVIAYLLKVVQSLRQAYDRIKSIVDKRNSEMKAEMLEIEKAMSVIHRKEYVYGKNAVKTYAELLDKNLTTLSNADMVRLSNYIRQNAYRFKTRIAISMKKAKNLRINFKKTVKNSIRADGVPYKIERQKPKPSKTKIITICDVSGSCIKSSKMLLNFLYELQSVFPGGCESFVFISDLADVTSVFKEMDIDDACSQAVSMVPRKYSDYGAAFTSFKDHYLSHITKDTIIIILGDARNNNNPTGEEIVKEIGEKSKKIYWLETDPKNMWGDGDSAIYAYEPYVSEIRELLKPQDIVDFLCNVAS